MPLANANLFLGTRFAKDFHPRTPKPRYEMPRADRSHLLTIDPSACSLGYAVWLGGELQDSGTWTPSKATSAKDRYDQLSDFLKRLLVPAGAYDVVVETPSGGGYRMQFTTGVVYGRAIGVVEGVCNVLGANVYRLPVNAWKGNQRKGWTRTIVKAVLKIDPATDDESDSLGIGLFWIEGQKRLRLMEERK